MSLKIFVRSLKDIVKIFIIFYWDDKLNFIFIYLFSEKKLAR